MSTAAQIDANRENAQQSTGPTTADGKATASQNAYRHGLRSANPVGPGEDPAEYRAFAMELLDDLQPVGIAQRLLAERIAQLQWKLQRVPVAEWTELEGYRLRNLRAMQQATGKLKPAMPAGSLLAGNLGKMLTLQSYEMRIHRAIETTHRQLRQLQHEAAACAEAAKASQPAATAVKATVIAPAVTPPPAGDAAKPSAGQQLDANWVRSSGSGGDPPAPPSRGSEEAVA